MDVVTPGHPLYHDDDDTRKRMKQAYLGYNNHRRTVFYGRAQLKFERRSVVLQAGRNGQKFSGGCDLDDSVIRTEVADKITEVSELSPALISALKKTYGELKVEEVKDGTVTRYNSGGGRQFKKTTVSNSGGEQSSSHQTGP